MIHQVIYYFVFFILIAISIYLFFRSKKYESLYKNIVIESKYKKTYTEIIDTLNESVRYIMDVYHEVDVLKERMYTRDSLSSEGYKTITLNVLKTFLKTFPQDEFKYYDKFLNGNAKELVCKIIHKKLIETDTKLKINIKNVLNTVN